MNQILNDAGEERAAPDPRVATVTRVVDGDTVRVRFVSGSERRVRYIGIDAPERDEPCFAQATAANAALLRDGRVRLAFDEDREDRHGRLLAYVYKGRTFVNAELVRLGYATPLVVAPNDRFARQIAAAAREAPRPACE